MHYKNGTEARLGDQVIGLNASGKVIVGTLWNLNAAADSCNAQVAHVIPGGVQHDYVSVKDLYYAGEAFDAAEWNFCRNTPTLR